MIREFLKVNWWQEKQVSIGHKQRRYDKDTYQGTLCEWISECHLLTTQNIHCGECVRALLFLCPYRDMWWTNERKNEWNDLYVNNNYNYNWKSMRTTFTAYYTLTYHIYWRFRSERMFKRRTTFFYILKEKFNWKRMSSYRRTIFKTKAENFQRKFTTTIWMTQIDCIFNTTL